MKAHGIFTMGEIEKGTKGLERLKRVQTVRRILAAPHDTSREELLRTHYEKEQREQEYLQECISQLLELKTEKGIEPEELAQAIAPNEDQATDAILRYARADMEEYLQRRFEDIRAVHDRKIYKIIAAGLSKIENNEELIESIEAETETRITKGLAQLLYENKDEKTRNLAQLMAKTFITRPQELQKYAYDAHDIYTILRQIHEE